ncbi:MAG: hypothetical protein KDC04_09090, partial [Saprospiraceae bacterium]|nr:hypothetical protein [Saprospiraceae bacterium]
SNHGCVSTGTVTVTVHPLPSVTIQGDSDVCMGSSTVLTASGGSSYTWSTGASGSSITVSPSSTTTYTVTVTSDHGCISTGTVTVTVHPLPSVTIQGDSEICFGSSTVLTASGGGTYAWNTGVSGSSITVTPIETTTYTVTVTSDHGCISTGWVTVTVHPLPEIIIEGDTTICAGSCTTLTVVGD